MFLNSFEGTDFAYVDSTEVTDDLGQCLDPSAGDTAPTSYLYQRVSSPTLMQNTHCWLSFEGLYVEKKYEVTSYASRDIKCSSAARAHASLLQELMCSVDQVDDISWETSASFTVVHV